jgi:hypothetical protein
MGAEYGNMFMQQLPFAKSDFVAGIKNCAIAIGAAIANATAFVALMWSTFGTRIAAALGGVSFTSLTVWEAVGVALAAIPTDEIIVAGIATVGTVLDLYLAYVCIGGLATT